MTEATKRRKALLEAACQLDSARAYFERVKAGIDCTPETAAVHDQLDGAINMARGSLLYVEEIARLLECSNENGN